MASTISWNSTTLLHMDQLTGLLVPQYNLRCHQSEEPEGQKKKGGGTAGEGEHMTFRAGAQIAGKNISQVQKMQAQIHKL